MAFTEFCCRASGSNLNPGTRTGNSTVPGTGPALTYALGDWVASTGVFTVLAADPVADGVAVGDFASVYATGATITNFVGRVTARDTLTITVSLTAKAGTAPTDGTGNRELRIGGAWLGPNAASGFPFNFIQPTLTNSTPDTPRVNFMNDAQYNITAAMTHTIVGPITFQGFTTAYADLGKAAIDGGTGGAGYTLLVITGANTTTIDLIFANNGSTGGSPSGLTIGAEGLALRCVVHDTRGVGIFINAVSAKAVECETYNCNQSNTAGNAGIYTSGTGIAIRCISHDNSGSGSSGFAGNTFTTFLDCIADSNGQHGFNLLSTNGAVLLNCDAYNNAADGINLGAATTANYYIENCNLIKNGGYGINGSGTTSDGVVTNCGFGSGTQVNTSGATNLLTALQVIGTVTYPANVTPWVDPANGDFRINLAAAEGTGRGTFTETQASYTGTVGYPDRGAAQHLGGGIIGIING